MFCCLRVSCLISLCGLLSLTAGCSSSKETAPRDRSEIVVEEGRRVSAGQLVQEPTADLAREFLRNVTPPKRSEVDIVITKRADFLGTEMRLHPDVVKEIERAEFSRLDAHYLAEVLMFAELARYLDLNSYPELIRAREAMDWVHRNVYRTTERTFPAPASYVARRGSGDTLERAYVFLALCEQLGIDTCFIGPPDAEEQLPVVGPDDAPPLTPFWAVGARIGNQIYMFDPYSGLPWTAEGQDRPATLADLRRNPTQFEKFRTETASIKSLSLDEMKQASVYLAPPLSALAPRMETLAKRFVGAIAVRTAIDPIALKERMTEATIAPVRFWRVQMWRTGDGTPSLVPTPLHVLIQFFPADQGGLAPSTPNLMPFGRYQFELVPVASLPPIFRQLPIASLQVILGEYAAPFTRMIMDPDGPYSLAARGHQAEAIRSLTQVRIRALQSLENQQVNPDMDSVAAWGDEITKVVTARQRAIREADPQEKLLAEVRLEDLLLALRHEPGQTMPPPRTDRSVVDRDLGREAAKLLLETRARQLMIRATFRLAICSQERAEWQQLRVDEAGDGATSTQRRDLHNAWINGTDWWEQYLRQFKDADPRRTEHATEMVERARRMVRETS